MPTAFFKAQYPFRTAEGEWIDPDTFRRDGKLYRTAQGAADTYGLNADSVRSWAERVCAYLGRTIKPFMALRPLSRKQRVAVFPDDALAEAHQQKLANGKKWSASIVFPVDVEGGRWISATCFVTQLGAHYVTATGATKLGAKKNLNDWRERGCRFLGHRTIRWLKVAQPYSPRRVIVYLLEDVETIISCRKASAAKASPPADSGDDRGLMAPNTSIQDLFSVSEGFASYWRKQPSKLRPGQKALRSEKRTSLSKYGRALVMHYSTADAERILAGKEGQGVDVGRSRRRRPLQERRSDDLKSITAFLGANGPLPLPVFKSRLKDECGIGWERARKLKRSIRKGKLVTNFCTWAVGSKQHWVGLPSQRRSCPDSYVAADDRRIAQELFDELKRSGPLALLDLQSKLCTRFDCSIPTITRIRKTHKDKLKEQKLGPLAADEASDRTPWKTYIALPDQEFPLSASDRRLKESGELIEAILRELGDRSTAELKEEFLKRSEKELDSDTLSLCHRRGLASIAVRKESSGQFPRLFVWSYVEPPNEEPAAKQESDDRRAHNGPLTIEAYGPINVNDRSRMIEPTGTPPRSPEPDPAITTRTPTKKKPGRPRGARKSDPEFDRQVYEAWRTREHTSYETLGVALDISAEEVEQALDRHRKRRPDANGIRTQTRRK